MQKIKRFFDLIDTDTGAAWALAAFIVIALLFNPMVIGLLLAGAMGGAVIAYIGTPVRRWIAIRQLEKSFVNTE